MAAHTLILVLSGRTTSSRTTWTRVRPFAPPGPDLIPPAVDMAGDAQRLTGSLDQVTPPEQALGPHERHLPAVGKNPESARHGVSHHRHDLNSAHGPNRKVLGDIGNGPDLVAGLGGCQDRERLPH